MIETIHRYDVESMQDANCIVRYRLDQTNRWYRFLSILNMRIKQSHPIANDVISLLELKLLVRSIVNKHAKIRIKCLTEGGTWTNQFLSVMMVTEKGLVLNDDSNDKIKSIEFLDQVIQFMIDKPFDSYHSNLTYVVN